MTQFQVVDMPFVSSTTQRDVVYLSHTGWDDWFKFSTLYDVIYVDADGTRHRIGGTKIGQFGLKAAGRGISTPGYRQPDLPTSFESLDDRFFSLGQDTSYYEALSSISSVFRERLLRALHDIAYDQDLRARAEAEPVTKVSLLREVPLSAVKEQFARLAHGGALLTPYRFGFRSSKGDPRTTLSFSVEPNSRPPTNIHVLIGRNGVGKSTMLNRLAKAMVEGSRRTGSDGQPKSGPWNQLTNVVSISFSAFDAFEPLGVPQDRTKGLTYHYVGLKKVESRKGEDATKDPVALSREMSVAAKSCLVGARRPRLSRALRLLESDPIFAATGLADLVAASDTEEALTEIPEIFRRLSSGHKIVLLTITKLVETVQEKSLVLLDEPEAHLHPPLLSAFIRALSDLLTNRNGMAIIATHSPVVLQEVPRSCVWKLRRTGDTLGAERPQIETFGENVSTLTDEVFGLEVTSTGFHKMLAEAATEQRGYEEALALFGDQLGTEGRAILRAMIHATSTGSHVAR